MATVQVVLWCAAVLALSACAGVCDGLLVQPLAERGHLTTLLFYTCVTKQVGNQCDEGFTLDQTGVANRGVSNNFTTIAAGKTVNISTLFAVHDTFFVNGQGQHPQPRTPLPPTAWWALDALSSSPSPSAPKQRAACRVQCAVCPWLGARSICASRPARSHPR